MSVRPNCTLAVMSECHYKISKQAASANKLSFFSELFSWASWLNVDPQVHTSVVTGSFSFSWIRHLYCTTGFHLLKRTGSYWSFIWELDNNSHTILGFTKNQYLIVSCSGIGTMIFNSIWLLRMIHLGIRQWWLCCVFLIYWKEPAH